MSVRRPLRLGAIAVLAFVAGMGAAIATAALAPVVAGWFAR